MAEPGRLFVVSTPIGNMEDVTLRALRVLREADRVYAEDTRHTRNLLSRHGIDKPLTSLHEHNEASRIAQVLEAVREGANLALVTDAGTPAISDPGFPLIRAAREAGIAVEVVPGASAILTALVGSGLPTDAFAFLGFPPRKGKERTDWARRTLGIGMTAVFYESPHRVVDTLRALASLEPAREAVVCRELTKMHEEFLRGTAESLAVSLGERDAVKGEVTVVLAPGRPAAPTEIDTKAEIERLREEGKGVSEIAKAIAKATGRSRREIYAELVDRSKP